MNQTPPDPRPKPRGRQANSRAKGAKGWWTKPAIMVPIVVAVISAVGAIIAALKKGTSGGNTLDFKGNNSGQVVAGNLTFNNTVVNSNPPPTGTLVPRNQKDSTEGHGSILKGNAVETGFDLGLVRLDVPPGVAALPFGKHVPLFILKTTNGILVSGEFKSLDGKLMAELINNEWREYPKNRLKMNSDSSSLEVVDDYNVPWFQIEYVAPDTIRVGGIFRAEGASWMDKYPALTNSIAFPAAFLGPGMLSIVGNGQTQMRGVPRLETDAQREEFANQVRAIVKPWFDYTPSKGQGIRLAK